jgi:hypothetical protein
MGPAQAAAKLWIRTTRHTQKRTNKTPGDSAQIDDKKRQMRQKCCEIYDKYTCARTKRAQLLELSNHWKWWHNMTDTHL